MSGSHVRCMGEDFLRIQCMLIVTECDGEYGYRRLVYSMTLKVANSCTPSTTTQNVRNERHKDIVL